jgi:ketosteroid isomerase-like protein
MLRNIRKKSETLSEFAQISRQRRLLMDAAVGLMTKSAVSLLSAVVLLFGTSDDVNAQASLAETGEISTTIERFHRALVQGDRAVALVLLAPDAVILEGGEAQTRTEYQREHLADDIAFARATKTERSQPRIQRQSDVAWVTATSKTTGTFNGRKIDSVGVELMVLTKGDAGWRIHAIHWSSHSNQMRK